MAAQRDAAFVNAISQQVMKLTSPGVPDIYQGTELWDDSLVDPDNRRPVDFEVRQKMLRANSSLDEPLADRVDGGIKLLVTQKLLRYREMHPELFAEGEYTHVRVAGPASEHVIAYSREFGGNTMLVVLPRLMYLLAEGGAVFGNTEIWADTSLQLSAAMPTEGWKNLLTDESIANPAVIDQLFAKMPLAVLIREGD